MKIEIRKMTNIEISVFIFFSSDMHQIFYTVIINISIIFMSILFLQLIPNEI